MAIPTLAPNSTWFAPVNGTTRASITEINIVDSYTPTGKETDSWDASSAKDGSVMCYLNGTVLTIAGNGSGKIYANADSSYLFYKSKTDMFEALTVINGIETLDTRNVTTFEQSFCRCLSLSSLDLRSWDVSNVTKINAMFQHCVSLEIVNLTGWNTSKVTGLVSLFTTSGAYGNSHLHTILGIGDWDVSNVTDMSAAFQMCLQLKHLDLGKWNTKSLVNMSNIFYNCSFLKSLNLSGWDTSTVTNMANAFGNMYRMEKITLGANFSFTGNGSTSCTLPTPDPAYISGADGNWYDINKTAYAPSAIPSNTAGTYYASLELVDKALNGSSAGKKYLLNRIFSPVIARVLMRKEG